MNSTALTTQRTASSRTPLPPIARAPDVKDLINLLDANWWVL